MTPKSIDDAIKNLQELDKMYFNVRYAGMYKIWHNSVDEHYNYLIDRCELFVKQAFRANINQTGLVFCIHINNVQTLEFSIMDANHITALYDGELKNDIPLSLSNYQTKSEYGAISCQYLIKAFEHLQEYQTQLNKFKNLKSAVKS